MKRIALRAALVALVFATSAGAAWADEPFGEPIAAEELDDVRGGFVLPTGIEAEFGAIARTYSNGALILETRFTWAPDGTLRENITAASVLARTDELRGAFVLRDANGATVFAHHLDQAGLRNVILNTADNRDIRVDTQLTVTLPSFDVTQQNISHALLSLRLADDFNAVR